MPQYNSGLMTLSLGRPGRPAGGSSARIGRFGTRPKLASP